MLQAREIQMHLVARGFRVRHVALLALDLGRKPEAKHDHVRALGDADRFRQDAAPAETLGAIAGELAALRVPDLRRAARRRAKIPSSGVTERDGVPW